MPSATTIQENLQGHFHVTGEEGSLTAAANNAQIGLDNAFAATTDNTVNASPYWERAMNSYYNSTRRFEPLEYKLLENTHLTELNDLAKEGWFVVSETEYHWTIARKL